MTPVGLVADVERDDAGHDDVVDRVDHHPDRPPVFGVDHDLEGFAGEPLEFRAGPIVGAGSASFEMLRYLTERLPVMICPRWLYTRAQPIAIRNVLDYLVAALDTPAGIRALGGPDASLEDAYVTLTTDGSLR